MNLLLLSTVLWASPQQELIQLLEENQPSSWKQQLVVTKQSEDPEQQFLLYGKRVDDVLYTRVHIEAPKKWAGIRISQIDHPNQADPFSLYLPALKRVNTVKNRSQTPLGLDLSLLDLQLNKQDQVEKLDDGFRIIRADEILILHFSQEELLQKIERTNLNGKLQEELLFLEWTTIKEYTLPARLKLTSHAKKEYALIQITTLAVNLSEEDLPLTLFLPDQLSQELP
jgi:hypothetical protein